MPSAPQPAAKEQTPELPRTITRLAFIGGLCVTLAVPGTIFVVAYESESARLEAAARTAAASVTGPLEIERIREQVAASVAWLGGETAVSVDIGDPLRRIRINRTPDPPLLTRTAWLDANGQQVQFDVSRSLQPPLLFALAMFAPGLLLGWATFVALKDVPMRAFRVALEEIAVRKATEERLAKSLSIFSATLESTADGILVTDTQGRAIVANQRFIDLWKLPKDAFRDADAGQTWWDLADQLRDAAAFVATQKDLTKHIDVDHAAVLELKDGRLLEWNSRPQYIDGIGVGRVSSFRDISERKRAEVLLAAEKEVLEMIVCGAPLKAALAVLARHVEVLAGHMFCAIVFREGSGKEARPACAAGPSLPATRIDGLVEEAQETLASIFADADCPDVAAHGLSDEFSGVVENIAANPSWAAYCAMMARLDIKPCFAVRARSSTGKLLGLVVAHYRTPVDQRPHDRELSWVAAHMTSIAIERRLAETRLRLLAHYDGLTRLPNRDLFRDRLAQALVHAERRKGLVAVMFLDLDRFKTVNDTLGHDAGDQLLIEITSRLRRCVREEDTVARLGGDEFTVILEQIAKPGDAAIVASKIVEALAAPVLLEGDEAFVTPSIGITIYPTDSTSAEELLKNADTAMYRVKEEGGNAYRFFTPEMNTLAANRLQMESGLRRAIERDEFVIYYQPKLDLSSGEIVGAEALLRWQHPDRGLVSPGEFIPILEETGLIEQVGLWVIRKVCLQLRAWQDARMPPLTVAVNLSGRQLQRAQLPATIFGILVDTGLAPKSLELEVTESMLMHDPAYAAQTLAEIRATGVEHIDVDDFGTGYSSLAYLKRFPIDALKLDKSFVDGLPHDEEDAAISCAVIALAHSLKLTVVAEGVETDEQLSFLHQNGCDVIQGFLLSRPLPAAAFARLVWDREGIAHWFAEKMRQRRVDAEDDRVARGAADMSDATSPIGGGSCAA